MATAVDAAMAETNQALSDMVDPLEGLHDFARLNLQPDAARDVGAAITDYERRKSLLQAFRVAGEALLLDGYPILALREVSQTALADLKDNQKTITAALQKFATNPAATMGLAPGAKESK